MQRAALRKEGTLGSLELELAREGKDRVITVASVADLYVVVYTPPAIRVNPHNKKERALLHI